MYIIGTCEYLVLDSISCDEYYIITIYMYLNTSNNNEALLGIALQIPSLSLQPSSPTSPFHSHYCSLSCPFPSFLSASLLSVSQCHLLLPPLE